MNSTSQLFKQISRLQIFYCLILAIFVRILVGHLPHSGENQPPIGGDYEAQRHWMEVTVHLPIREWYSQTMSNDLLYWGLDYPPLTAYVSRGIGLLAPKSLVRYRNSTLAAARFAAASKKPYVDGDEILPIIRENNNKVDWHSFFTAGLSMHKWFMRASVIATDILVYFPAVLSLVHVTNILGGFRKDESYLVIRSFISWLLLPSLLLIDHGHFQYNGVILGLVLAAVASLGHNNFLLSAFMFSLALNFKQMALYFAPVFFVYILSASLSGGFHFVVLRDRQYIQRSTILQSCLAIATVGLVVLCTFAFLWAPFCIFETPEGLKSINLNTCIRGLSAVVYRIFPFSRNIFEDKVANFWCALEPVLGFRKWILTNPQDTSKIALMSTISTLFLSSPGLYFLFLMKRENTINGERENPQGARPAPSLSLPPPIQSRAVTRNREKKRKASLARAIELNLTNTTTLRRKSQRLSFQSNAANELYIDPQEDKEDNFDEIGDELTTQESPTPVLNFIQPKISNLINPFTHSLPPPLPLPLHSSHSPLCMFESFLLCLFLSSISFFLVSFQVHEKSILLPLIPLHALYYRLPLLSLWFTSMSLFSLWPLFVKDGLFSNITAMVLVLGFLTNALNYPRTQIGNSLWPWYRAPSKPPFNYIEEASSIVLVIEHAFGVQTARTINVYKIYTILYRIALTMVIASLGLGLAAYYIPPPSSKPDIFPYLTAVLCAFNFAIIYVIALAVQYKFLKSR